MRRDEAKRSKVRQGRARVGFPRFRFARFLPAVVSGLRRVLLGFSPPFLSPSDSPFLSSFPSSFSSTTSSFSSPSSSSSASSSARASSSQTRLSLSFLSGVVSSTSSLPPFFPAAPALLFLLTSRSLLILSSLLSLSSFPLSLSFFLFSSLCPALRGRTLTRSLLHRSSSSLSLCHSFFLLFHFFLPFTKRASTLPPYYSLTLRPEARDAAAKRAARTANYPPCRSTSCPPST